MVKTVRVKPKKHGADARTKFLRERKKYIQNQPFTKKENKAFTVQDKNFIRGIQVARRIDKKEAIKLFKKSKKSEGLSKNLSDDVARKYEMGITYREPPTQPPVRIKKEKPKKKEKPVKKEVKKVKKRIKKVKKIAKEKGAPKGKKYKYAGVAKGKTKKEVGRFKSLGGKSRRYIDTKTGEEISRRERDKRLSNA